MSKTLLEKDLLEKNQNKANKMIRIKNILFKNKFLIDYGRTPKPRNPALK